MMSYMQVKESKWLVKCFLNYLRHDKSEVNVLFDILSIFLFHSRIDYTFLKEFYIIEVICYRVIIISVTSSHFETPPPPPTQKNKSMVVCESPKNLIFFQVAEGYPPNMKRPLLLHFLNLFQSKQLAHDHLVVVMQMLILPMLVHAFRNGQSWEVVDPGIIKTIVDKLLDPPEEVRI